MIKFSFCSLVNFKLMEDYFRRQSLKGYHLYDYWHIFSKLKKDVPRDYEYFIAFNFSEEDKAKTKVLYMEKENEYEYVCSIYKGLFIFRKASNKVTENDVTIRNEQYKKCAKLNKLGSLVWIVCLLLLIFGGFSYSFPDYEIYLYALDFAGVTLAFEEFLLSYLEHRENSTFCFSKKTKIYRTIIRLIQIASSVGVGFLYYFLFESNQVIGY